MDERVERIQQAAEYIKTKIGLKKPLALIVLGSGLGKLADKIEEQIVIPYTEIPHFAKIYGNWTQRQFNFWDVRWKICCSNARKISLLRGLFYGASMLPDTCCKGAWNILPFCIQCSRWS